MSASAITGLCYAVFGCSFFALRSFLLSVYSFTRTGAGSFLRPPCLPVFWEGLAPASSNGLYRPRIVSVLQYHPCSDPWIAHPSGGASKSCPSIPAVDVAQDYFWPSRIAMEPRPVQGCSSVLPRASRPPCFKHHRRRWVVLCAALTILRRSVSDNVRIKSGRLPLASSPLNVASSPTRRLRKL